MPAVLSKFNVIAHIIQTQDDVIFDQLVHYKPAMRTCKNFNKFSCKRYSYELEKLRLNCYENFRIVLSVEKAKCLADFFFKGFYPQAHNLRILCDYYNAMYKRIKT